MLKKTMISLLAVAAVSTVHAADVTLEGTNYNFTYDDSTLFGTAVLNGDSISFAPTSFVAESNGDGLVRTSETINITITANNDSAPFIDLISVLEKGDYSLYGADSVVKANARLQLEYEGSPVVNTNDSVSYNAPADANFYEWQLNPFLALAGEVKSVRVQLQNTLTAIAEKGSSAFIQKKSGEVGVFVNEVPVPAAAWLFGSALLALGLKKKA